MQQNGRMTITKKMRQINRRFLVIMVVLITALVFGTVMYKQSSGGKEDQVSGTAADIYAREGILHLEMNQDGGSEHDNFVLSIQIDEEEYSGEVIVNGVVQNIKNGNLKLKGGQKADICRVPFGSSYQVTEKENISYTTRVNGDDTREASGIISEQAVEPKVIFFNTWGSGSLSLQVVNEGGIAERFFEFTVKMNGEPYRGAVRIEGNGHSEAEEVFEERKDGMIHLKENETAVFEDVSFGTDYEITMRETEGYTTIVDGLKTYMASGIVSGQNCSPTVVFENTYRNESGEDDRKNGGLSEKVSDEEQNEITTVKWIETGFAGMVFVEVRDQNGKPVEGARYQLFAEMPAKGNVSECWQSYEEDAENGIYTTNSAGIFVVSNLPANNYYFAELEKSDRYELSGKKYIFTVENASSIENVS